MSVKGTVLNAQPGFPAPSGATVNVQQIVGGQPLTVATAKTNSTGAYSIKFTPSSTGSYEVSTGQISQIEIPTLSPAYGDILSPASTTATKLTVHSALENFSVSSQGDKALVIGKVSPGTGHVKGTVAVFARAVGTRTHPPAFKKVATPATERNPGQLRHLRPPRCGRLELQGEVHRPRAGPRRELKDDQGHDRPQADLASEPRFDQGKERNADGQRHRGASR